MGHGAGREGTDLAGLLVLGGFGLIVGEDGVAVRTNGDLLLLMGGLEEEVSDGDVDEVAAAEELDDPPLEQVGGHGDGDEAEDEGTDQAVGQGPGLQTLGQPTGEQAQHQGVVDGQHALENDQQAYDRQVL